MYYKNKGVSPPGVPASGNRGCLWGCWGYRHPLACNRMLGWVDMREPTEPHHRPYRSTGFGPWGVHQVWGGGGKKGGWSTTRGANRPLSLLN